MAGRSGFPHQAGKPPGRRLAGPSPVHLTVGNLGTHNILLASEMRGRRRVGLSPSPALALAGVGTEPWDIQLGSWRPAWVGRVLWRAEEKHGIFLTDPLPL